MKRVILIIWIIVSSVAADKANYYTLEDTRGRSLEANILSYDSAKQVVKLKLSNGKVRTAPISLFSETSQRSIRDWHVKSLLTPANLKVTFNKKTIESGHEHTIRDGWESSRFPGMGFEDIIYEIELYNKSSVDVTGLKLTYCIFYKQSVDERTYSLYLDGNVLRPTNIQEFPRKNTTETHIGDPSLLNLAPRKRVTVTTKVVRLYEGGESKEVENSQSKRGRTIKQRMLGVRVRISIPLSSGKYAMNEYSYPSDLITKTEWPENSPTKNMEPMLKTPID